METQLPDDFSAFLRSLNEANVEYLLVGGYAVGYHGYVRVTGDIDVWVRQCEDNAARTVTAIRAFGFDVPDLSASTFLSDNRIVRMGLPPHRVEVMTSISGVDFDACWQGREMTEWDGVSVPLINLRDLRTNKAASGRPKDIADLVELPDPDA